MANKIVNKTCPECGKVFRTRDAEKIYCSLPCKQEAKERKLIIKTKGPNKETEEMTESIKSSIEAKIKASEEALAKSEREQLQLKARVETLYEIYNNLRENAA